MTDELVARRYPASEFPEIQGIWLSPPGTAASLINLSATGVLVGCAARLLPGTLLTVSFKGTFKPTTIESRVVRCEVAGIASDGSLQFQLGLAFSARIALAQDADTPAEALEAAEGFESAGTPEAGGSDVPMPVVAAVAPRASTPTLRNRW